MRSYKEEQKMYNELEDRLVKAFVYEVPVSELKEIQKIFEANEWTKSNKKDLGDTLKWRLYHAEKRENAKMIKVSSHVLTETEKFLSLHMN